MVCAMSWTQWYACWGPESSSPTRPNVGISGNIHWNIAVPQNTVMDLNNVMCRLIDSLMISLDCESLLIYTGSNKIWSEICVFCKFVLEKHKRTNIACAGYLVRVFWSDHHPDEADDLAFHDLILLAHPLSFQHNHLNHPYNADGISLLDLCLLMVS